MEPLVRKNPEVIFELQMSIDQTGEAHDKSRKVKNLYRTAIKSFRALSDLRAEHPNLKLKVNIVYLDTNRESVDRIVSELSKEIEFNRVQLTFPHELVPAGARPESVTSQGVKEYVKVADRLTKRISSPFDPHTIGILAVKGVYHRLLGEAVQNKRNVGSYCEAGRYIIVVDEKG